MPVYILFLLASLISINFAYNPYCFNCKFFIPNDIDPHLATCKRFKDFSYYNNKITLVNKLAINCRDNDNLCGINGNSYQTNLLNKQLADDLDNLSNRCCGEVNETDEIEQLERDFFDILQKIKKHNKRNIYNTSKDLYKLFRRSE